MPHSPLDPDRAAAGPASALDFPIVGIGASAGGLAAFEAFFSGMPRDADSGMAFVVVQHLAPHHKSMLSDLVQRCTRMQVTEIEDGTRVSPDRVYVVPPNRDLQLARGTLRLSVPEAPRGRRLPIDSFFKSLAEDQHERAIGVVLSGTGSDGTLGLRAIKGEGGMAMAQAPETAEHDSMPRTAIATGMVDYVLPPAQMLPRLISYATHAYGRAPRFEGAPAEGAMESIFVLLRARTGRDFSGYKQSTVLRRIERRMAVQQVERLEDYARLLHSRPAEVDALFRDLLIRVTSFFRDPEAFEALGQQVAARLIEHRQRGAPLRAWVPGCSTGEEAYSVAMLLREQVEARELPLRIQVFATDIDLSAIERARSGTYPAGIASELTPERLVRFFELDPERSVYRVKKSIRDLLIFSEQDVIRDPPFSRLDLITCRNLMIYLGAELQQELIPLLHYALNPGGLLFLGTSESVGDHRELFMPLQPGAKVYLRRDDVLPARRPPGGKLFPKMSDRRMAVGPPGPASHERGRLPLRELTERALLLHASAVAALVNERGDLLYVHGRTGRFLEPAPGESSLNVLSMAREGLRRDLTLALREAVAGGRVVRRQALRVRTNGHVTTAALTIRPMTAEPPPLSGPTVYAVILEEAPDREPQPLPADAELAGAVAPAAGTGEGPATEAGRTIAALQRELRDQAEYLLSTRQDLEASNGELKAANEELQSLNEELQSTNEELETAKEELQSVNEELATVNTELQQRVAQLSRSNNDLNNLMAGTGVGTIFVDHDLRIQRFTPAATAMINLIPTDVGRPIGQIVLNLVGYDHLVPDVQSVLNTLTPREVEVRSRAAWYLLRIRPYRTLENVIEGAVITFTDITQIKQAQEALRRLAVVVRDSRDAILVQDLSGRILAWNPGAERLYGWTASEALERNIRDLVPEGRRESVLAEVQQLGKAGSIRPARSQRIARDGTLMDIELTATALLGEAGEVYAISTTERAAPPA